MKIKKLKKKIYSDKKPTKLWTMSAKSDKFFYYSKRKKTKLLWPMNAKSDTWLPGSIYNKIRIFWIDSKNFISWDSGTDRESEGDEEKYRVEEPHVFELWRFEGESQISIFYRANILSKTFIPYCNHDFPKMFPHSYALLRCHVVYKNAFLWN